MKLLRSFVGRVLRRLADVVDRNTKPENFDDRETDVDVPQDPLTPEAEALLDRSTMRSPPPSQPPPLAGSIEARMMNRGF